MTVQDLEGRPSPAEILDAVSDHHPDEDGGVWTASPAAREAVEEFVSRLDAGETVHVRARRIVSELAGVSPIVGETFRDVGTVAPTDVGQALAAHAAGESPDGTLPGVNIERWRETADGGPTVWTIEVVDDGD